MVTEFSSRSPLSRPQKSPSHSDPESLPMIEDDLREIHLRRTSNFQGFGFHLEYNKIFYIIQKIEENSPAARSGLRTRDIILQINQEPTDNMTHTSFVKKVNDSPEIHFLVQNYDSYRRAHPEISSTNQVKNNTPNTPIKTNTPSKSRNTLRRVLSKLKSRWLRLVWSVMHLSIIRIKLRKKNCLVLLDRCFQ